MKLIVLGTGAAMVEELFNTCFVLDNSDKGKMLVDTGGGNQILSRFKKANIKLEEIHDIFMTHKHTDHILGILWVIRKVEGLISQNKYEGNLTIYCHQDLERVIRGLCELTLKKRFIELLDDRIILKVLNDRECVNVIGSKLTALDIKAKSDTQYGFKLEWENNKSLLFSGDEPLSEDLYDITLNSDYLCHEAFCLDTDSDKYTPYKFNHDTAKSAAEKAEKLNVKNLILWHTREEYGIDRQKSFSEEAKKYFRGNIMVPNDLDIINL